MSLYKTTYTYKSYDTNTNTTLNSQLSTKGSGYYNKTYGFMSVNQSVTISGQNYLVTSVGTTTQLQGYKQTATNRAFAGNFDGNGHTITISGMTAGGDGAYETQSFGIFGYNTGTIRNLTVANSSTINTSSRVLYGGLIVGYNAGTVTNCSASGSLSITNNNNGYTILNRGSAFTQSNIYVGGAVGYNSGTISQVDVHNATLNAVNNMTSLTTANRRVFINEIAGYQGTNLSNVFYWSVTKSATGTQVPSGSITPASLQISSGANGRANAVKFSSGYCSVHGQLSFSNGSFTLYHYVNNSSGTIQVLGTPTMGYELDTVTIDGSTTAVAGLQGSTDKFTYLIDEDTLTPKLTLSGISNQNSSLVFNFVSSKFGVTATASTGGTAYVGDQLNVGTRQSFRARRTDTVYVWGSPSAGYAISGVSINGTNYNLGATGSTGVCNYVISSSTTSPQVTLTNIEGAVLVEFIYQAKSYQITVSATGGGTGYVGTTPSGTASSVSNVTVAGTYYVFGQPNEYRRVKHYVVNGSTITPGSGGTVYNSNNGEGYIYSASSDVYSPMLTLSNVTANLTVSVVYEYETYNITSRPNNSSMGTVATNTTGTVPTSYSASATQGAANYGAANYYFFAKPAVDYRIDAIVIDGTTIALGKTDQVNISATINGVCSYEITRTTAVARSGDANSGVVTIRIKNPVKSFTIMNNFVLGVEEMNTGNTQVIIGGSSSGYSAVYDGEEQRPSIVVRYNGTDVTSFVNVSYSDNINAGEATVTISGDGVNYKGTITKNFTISPKSIAGSTIKVDGINSSYVYKGSEWNVTPLVTDEDLSSLLTADTDYTVSYLNNIDSFAVSNNYAEVIITGKGNYSGTKSVKFTIEQAELGTTAIVQLPSLRSEYTYTGSQIQPEYFL